MGCKSSELDGTWYKLGIFSCLGYRKTISNLDIPEHNRTCPDVLVRCHFGNEKALRKNLANHKSPVYGKPKSWKCFKCEEKFDSFEKEEHKKSCELEPCSNSDKYSRLDELTKHWQLLARGNLVSLPTLKHLDILWGGFSNYAKSTLWAVTKIAKKSPSAQAPLQHPKKLAARIQDNHGIEFSIRQFTPFLPSSLTSYAGTAPPWHGRR